MAEVKATFVSGRADPRRQPELRVASFREVLRFWWWALTGGMIDGNLSALREAETAAFGETESGLPIVFDYRSLDG